MFRNGLADRHRSDCCLASHSGFKSNRGDDSLPENRAPLRGVPCGRAAARAQITCWRPHRTYAVRQGISGERAKLTQGLQEISRVIINCGASGPAEETGRFVRAGGWRRRAISSDSPALHPSAQTGSNGIVTPRRTCGPFGGPVAKRDEENQLRRLPLPARDRSAAIWLRLRFTPSLRDVEDLRAEGGTTVSYAIVRRWMNHFGPMVAADLRKRRPKPHTTWRLDEVYLKIDGRMVHLWRAVDAIVARHAGHCRAKASETRISDISCR